METNELDLLTRLLTTHWIRNLIAIAIFARMSDVYYDAGKPFIRGVQQGWEEKAWNASTANAACR